MRHKKLSHTVKAEEASQLRSARRQLKLSQSDFKHIGLNRDSVNKIESGGFTSLERVTALKSELKRRGAQFAADGSVSINAAAAQALSVTKREDGYKWPITAHFGSKADRTFESLQIIGMKQDGDRAKLCIAGENEPVEVAFSVSELEDIFNEAGRRKNRVIFPARRASAPGAAP